jgi:hypothetical protein
MFRSSTIIKELVLSLPKVILKHSVKLYSYSVCGSAAACLGEACVLCAVHSAQHTTQPSPTPSITPPFDRHLSRPPSAPVAMQRQVDQTAAESYVLNISF